MATTTPYVSGTKDTVVLSPARTGGALTSHGIVRRGRLRSLGLRLPRLAFEWQDLRGRMQRVKIRWGWVLLLAVILVLAMGEWGPAVSAIAALP
jgi:hypothetical protein